MHHAAPLVVAQRVVRRVGRRAVVNANYIVIQPFIAAGAVLATTNDAGDADRITRLEVRYMCA